MMPLSVPTTDPTALGCRSLFRVQNQPDFTDLVHQQLYAWCKDDRKRWDADQITGPGVYEVADGVTASLVRDERQDGSIIERYRFHQDEGQGIWITHLTTFADRNHNGWVWTDVFQPTGRGSARVPRLAKNILEVVDGLDGRHPLTARPVRAGTDDLEEIVAALTDDQRRGFLFLAGANDAADIPQSEWARYVDKLLVGTAGLASAYVLDSAATRELNAQLPESHRVTPWTIRTFHPNPEFTDPQDSIRHRVLSTARIIDDNANRLRNRLAESSCRHSTTIALPRELVRIDRVLRGLLDELIVDETLDVAAAASEAILESAPLHSGDREQLLEPVDALPPTDPTVPATIWQTLTRVVSTVTGAKDVTIDAVNHLGKLATEALSLRPQVADLSRLRDRLRSVQTERNDLEDLNTELNQRLTDSRDEFAVFRIDLADAQAEVRRLARELAKLDRGDVDWNLPDKPIDTPPISFEDLIDRFGEFDHVVFTGDEKPALDLDDHDSADWAIATWGYLRVLDEYCAERSDGTYDRAIADYIRSRQKGHATIPPGIHAPDETAQTYNNTKFRRQRQFKVPPEVDADGYAYMGEHIKIAKYGTVSPRMHILNRASDHGKIYVGYIGRHLVNFRTN
ncbi:hypothetical protein GOHSU_18_01390 [Gordonia hirsuta DSM 44140 = NBRC 16056]|uniref:Uncharacterized protein n=2 Tax=Gordonia hirsuta TaxID=53427 RepID=L7L8X0_9ACTN|nr:hypothetical protein GOHSU_18_01390 [Gordonia hirsuta DSM 44140 = NBRC 16056]